MASAVIIQTTPVSPPISLACNQTVRFRPTEIRTLRKTHVSIQNPLGQRDSDKTKTEDAFEYATGSYICNYINNLPQCPLFPTSHSKRLFSLSPFEKPFVLEILIMQIYTLSEQEQLIEKLELFKIKGRDKRGRTILRVIGKFLPVRLVSIEALNKYLEKKVFPQLKDKAFSIVYVHTNVQRSENFPGISGLRSIYDAIPLSIKENLEAFYFVHPGLQARLFLATFGRFLFSGGLYGKLEYVSRLDLLWDHVRRHEIEIPEFVYDHDEALEYRPMMDYGLESDHPRIYGAPAVEASPVSAYSMRCIS